MIKYAIICDQEHVFDVWFADSALAQRQIDGGQVSCPSCGSTRVRKALMAPRISASRPAEPPAPLARAPETAGGNEAAPPPGGSAPAPRALLEKLWALRAAVERDAEHVGAAFADEARRIQDGEAPERPIWGECAVEDAVDLWQEGAPVAPLPPKRPENA